MQQIDSDEKIFLTLPGLRPIVHEPADFEARETDMTRSELIEEVAKTADISKDKAALVVSSILNGMTAALRGGERIEIRNFGNFVVREYESYVGRNPKSGEKVIVPQKKMPFFRAGLELKRMIND